MRTRFDVPLRRIGRDRAGGAAVEMALVVPLMLGLIGGTFDFARGFSAKLDLVAAASRTAELATAPGQVRTDYSYLATEAVAAAGRDDAVAAIDWWLECNGVRRNDVTVCPSGQAYARYVSVEIDATYSPVLGLGGYLVGVIPIQGSAEVRIQ
jgi:Flp pilus assembly protein TadG